ncbi:MAG TPA: stealth conserved region 3 domain-containing protein [Microbacterium sp.]|uniref:stealth conserved region 3 domain-containing protein n=1 Tax=Microbacterium sp. TaxID=51671 RepID=UPI002C090355|nr:stealth conserved region 3 domain-containing protein [Microbacterium sp.]HWI32354.1 stealth conserved region 3 domain-containing protein [Microbacterium sp.]
MTQLSALPPTTHPWTTLVARDDVVLDDGLLRLVHDDVTPDGALEADLGFVADVLEQAGIELTLVRDERLRPVIVVDAAARAGAIEALAVSSTAEPFYAKLRQRAPEPLFEFVGPAAEVWAVTLFRPRVSTNGSLRYGAEFGVRLEFWRFGAELVEAPRANALTRRVIATEDVEFTRIQRYGRSWRTIAGMFERHPREVTDEIDMVFSWVDGSSSDFQRQRALQMQEYVVGEGDDGPTRYRHVDELRYALRSVHMYAPWVRRIFIATDSDRPDWLADHPKVTIVRSEEFFADPSVLPTHNSHAVESQLHRIDGLAEHFLYSNDDMFFGRPVTPDLFFTSGGLSTFVEAPVRIGAGPARAHRSGHDNGLRVNRALLQQRFGRIITRDLQHCAAPMRRSIAAELENEFADDYARTAASRFRSATDISVTNSLYHYYALLTGRALPTTQPRVRYIQTTLRESLGQMEKLLERRDADMFCLNDGSVPEIPEEVRVPILRATLERYYPIRAPWELPAAERVGAASDRVSAAPRWESSAVRSGGRS